MGVHIAQFGSQETSYHQLLLRHLVEQSVGRFRADPIPLVQKLGVLI